MTIWIALPRVARRSRRESVRLRHVLLVGPFAFRPCALDEVENGADLRVAQHVCEAGHVTLVSATDDGGGTLLDDAEQDLVGLALQISAVAGGALICIDLPSLRDV